MRSDECGNQGTVQSGTFHLGTPSCWTIIAACLPMGHSPRKLMILHILYECNFGFLLRFCADETLTFFETLQT